MLPRFYSLKKVAAQCVMTPDPILCRPHLVGGPCLFVHPVFVVSDVPPLDLQGVGG